MSAVATPSAVPTVAKKTTKGTGTKEKTAKPKAVAKKTSKGKTAPQTVAKKTTKGKKAPAPANEKRTFGLDSAKADELRKAKAFNAYRPGSSYWLCVESLHSLGVGKYHPTSAIVAEYQKQADKDALRSFKSKEKRNDTSGLDWKDRIIQNCYVTCRSDYGQRQRDIGWEVRCERSEDGQTFGLFRLNGKGK